MTPKEKADQIFTLMLKHQHKTVDSLMKLRAKESALHAVWFMLEEVGAYRDLDSVIWIDDKLTNPIDRTLFYQKVRKEIMKI
jgi:hypothetical protein